MSFSYHLSPSDYRKFYLQYYYNRNYPAAMILRLFAGPIIILLGVFLITKGIRPSDQAMGGAQLAAGIYYTLLPFLHLRARKMPHQDLEAVIGDTRLFITSPYSETSIDFAFMKRMELSSYFILQLPNSNVIYLPKDQVGMDILNALREKVQA